MWERFSYYGMRALLVLYLTQHLLYQRQAALEIYGLYTGLVYLTPIIGGFIADRWLGYRGTVLSGAILMMLGHFAMAFPQFSIPRPRPAYSG
jgi:proton-dependent oligopeptide transporter, POT family